MDRSWMNEPRLSTLYLDGVGEFLNFAFTNASSNGKISCPCITCANNEWVTRETATEHLVCNGFMKGYTTWIAHGEASSSSRSNAPIDDDIGIGMNIDAHHDMSGLLHDRFGAPESVDDTMNIETGGRDEEAEAFYHLLKYAEKELYPGCKTASTLSFIVELFNIKCLGKWSDSSLTMLLEMLNRHLPSGVELPKTFYEMKKIIGSLSLKYNKIDACPGDCMLYWKEHANDTECHICHRSRWAPEEENMDGEETSSTRKKKIPAKVLRHFPLIPRLKQLFMSKKTTSYMKWHSEKRTKDGYMRHPADSPAWQTFDYKNREFAKDARNIRLALATDGFNPFKLMSNSHSTWPVVLIPYNLPPWLCMKDPYLFLSLLIPGSESPGNNIDVYLQPLIEELKMLWEVGVETYDASSKSRFQMHAALLWTISDFPAYAYLSGWSTKGALACPVCHKHTVSRWLKHSRKHCYMGHRRFLDENHPFRKDKRSFDGTEDHRKAPPNLSGHMVLEDLRDFQHKYGKDVRDNPTLPFNYKKKSIFFELPYWKDNLVRHQLDVMHIEKNVCEAIIGTLLNLEGKTKDHHSARLDLEDMGIRADLHPVQGDSSRVYLPAAPFSMDKKEKDIFCKVLKKIRVPDGYSSNISRCVQTKSHKIFGLKSHDNHILMQQLLPLALRKVLPKKVRTPLIDLCKFFRELCSKVLHPRDLIKLQSQIAKTLCQLEKVFPPSFFDIMMHLPVHLANEARLCGPVHYRWMYPIERNLGTLKSYVRSKSRPEGSIAEGYLAQECMAFCSRYLNDIETKFNRPHRNDDGGSISTTELHIFSKPGCRVGGESVIDLDEDTLVKAHRYVLFNCDAVEPYITEHQNLVRNQNPRYRPRDITRVQNSEFASWLESYVMKLLLEGNHAEVPEELRDLSRGPHDIGKRYTGYLVNGFRFRIQERDKSKRTQNCGVLTTATTTGFSSARDTNPVSGEVTYYGILKDIIELNYPGGRNIVLFMCDWVGEGRRVKHDEYGFTLVNFTNVPEHSEPFVLASQVQQVFYVEDPTEKGWHVAIKTKARDDFDMDLELGIEDVDTYVQSDASSSELLDESEEISWAREGIDAAVVDLNRA